MSPYNKVWQHKDLADRVLEEFDDICKKAGIPYFLCRGTCLGFYRDGGYIHHDNDIDVGLVNEGSFGKLSQELKKGGFELISPSPPNAHFFKHLILVDVYYKIKSFESFDKVEHKGREYDVPHPVEEYLESVFGKDWRTPKYRK